jgi:hypothetical protein
MKNLYLAASTLLVLTMTATEANAQYCQWGNSRYGGAGEACRAGYHANVNWPRDYIPSSRRAVCQAQMAMIQNGWRRQNLLGDYHFDAATNALTEAGQLKVNWILSQAPVDHRSVFVQRGIDEEQTAARIAAVHARAANLSPGMGPVDVSDTHLVAEGHPAGAVDNVFVGFQANQPLPVLPANTGSDSSE